MDYKKLLFNHIIGTLESDCQLISMSDACKTLFYGQVW